MTELGASPLLAGRYDLGPVIGTGGMARVHRATDTLLDRPVAVKVFRLDSDPSHAARIRDEARTLAAVQHPGLVAVFDAGTWSRDDGSQVPYLVMELVEGTTLADCCLDGSLTADDVTRIGADLADALAHVHERGIVHRDVKPANILLDAARRPKLTDFGIARLVDSARHTQTGLTVGTAAYLSPEQVRGQDVGPPSDVYSLALVLLESLTGRREYAGNSVETALARLERPVQVPADVPPPLRALLLQMTALEPQDRPTAAEVTTALRSGPRTAATTKLLPTAPRPRVQRSESSPGVVGETARDAVRNPLVLGGLLLLLLVLAVVVAVLTGGGDSSPPDRSTPPDAPVSQLEKDLADLRDAVTP